MHKRSPGRLASARPSRLAAVLRAALATALVLGPAPAAAASSNVRRAPPGPFVRPLELPASAGGTGDTGGLEHLLIDNQVLCGPGHAHYHRLAERISSAAGLESASQVRVELDPTYQTLTFHHVTLRRGEERLDALDLAAVKLVQRESGLDQQVYDGLRTAVLFVPGVRVGDVLDFAYTVSGEAPLLPGRCVVVLPLGATVPVGVLRARIALPAGRALRVGVVGPTVDLPVRHSEGGLDVYELIRRPAPAYPFEPRTPDGYSSSPVLQASDFASWQAVGEWGTAIFKRSHGSPAAVRKLAARLSREAGPTGDFATRATRFVQDEIRYVALEEGLGATVPSEPQVVLTRRFGDCKDKSVLLTELLRAGGLEAAPALVSTFTGPKLDAWLPTPTVFDHAIVRLVGKDGVPVYVDATLRTAGGVLRDSTPYWLGEALPLETSTPHLESIPVPEHPGELHVSERYDVTTAGGAGESVLEVERTYRGNAAADMRRQLESASADQLRDFLLGLYKATYPRVRALDAAKKADDRDANELRLSIRLTLPEAWQELEGGAGFRFNIAPPPIGAMLPERPAAERKAPLALRYPLVFSSSVEVVYGYQISLEDRHAQVEGPGFVFSSSSSYDGSRLHYTYELTTRRDRIEPADFEAYHRSLTRVTSLAERAITAPRARTGLAAVNWLAVAAVLVTAALMTWFARWQTRRQGAGPTPPDAALAPLEPIGGWLIVLVIQLVVTGLAYLVAWRTYAWVLDRRNWLALVDQVDAGKHVLAWVSLAEAVTSVVIFGGAVTLLVLMFQRRRKFVRGYLSFIWGVALLSIVDKAITASSLGSGDEAIARALVRALVPAGLWTAYVLMSQRVARTFVRE